MQDRNNIRLNLLKMLPNYLCSGNSQHLGIGGITLEDIAKSLDIAVSDHNRGFTLDSTLSSHHITLSLGLGFVEGE